MGVFSCRNVTLVQYSVTLSESVVGNILSLTHEMSWCTTFGVSQLCAWTNSKMRWHDAR